MTRPSADPPPPHSVSAGGGPPALTSDQRRLVAAMALVGAFMAVEVVTAVFAHSLALIADAGHMLTDVAALAGALVAARLAARPATTALTFGFTRAEILSAAANAVTLLAMALLVGYTAVRHLIRPVPVHGLTLVVVALVGVAVNVTASVVLGETRRDSLNLEGAFRHILTDLYAFIGTAVAGGVIAVTGFMRADAIASLLVVVLMMKAGVELLGPAVKILAEATPDDVDLAEVRRHLLELPEVLAVHDLHAWTVTSTLPSLTAHVVVTDACLEGAGSAQVLDRLQDCLATHFDVGHSTFQLEPLGHVDHEQHGHE